MDKDPFKEYIKQSEPNKRDRGYAWHYSYRTSSSGWIKAIEVFD